MSKRFLVILVGLVILFGGLLVFNKKEAGAPTGEDNGEPQLTEHTAGEGTAGVTLVEYGDFQCPACGQFYPIVQQIKEKYGDQITFQFRHLPLVEIHQNALVSARAAEAAGMQDKFWEMHDLLFEGQQVWSSSTNPTPIFEGYAEQIGLDLERFQNDMRSPETNRAVQADRAEARRLGLSSTPSFILNGQKIEELPRSFEAFSDLIDAAIAENQAN